MLDLPDVYYKMPPAYANYATAILQYVWANGPVSKAKFDVMVDRMVGHLGARTPLLYSPDRIRRILLQELDEVEEYVQGPDTYVPHYKVNDREAVFAEGRMARNRRVNSCPSCIRIMCVCDYSLMCLGDGPHSLGCHGTHD